MVRMHRGALGAALALLTVAGGTAAAAGDAVVVRVPAGTSAEQLLPASEPVVPARVADALAARAERRGVPAPDLSRWVRLDVATPTRAERVASALDARPGWVAQPASEPAPPPAVCRDLPAGLAAPLDPGAGATPSFTGLQDADDMLQIPSAAGADGAGIGVRDIEFDWNPAHEDLPGGLPGRPTWTRLGQGDRSDLSHGTAVLGTIAGAADGKGVSGLAPAATVRPVSPYVSATYDPAGAIATAAAASADGDVLLIEQQAYVGNMEDGIVGPVETDSSVRAAIAAAVAAGVVVVEPAGNGDLWSGPTPVAEQGGHDLATLGVTGDSGAIIVGAGTPSGAPALRTNGNPLGNFGSRVDVQGLGEGVVTTGYAALQAEGDGTRGYTHCFDGTSSASATVAGAIASLQGAVKARTGGVLAPGALRALLKSTGAAQQPGVAIGPRPQIATALGTILVNPPAAPTVTGGGAEGAFLRVPPAYTVATPAGTGADWSLAGPRALAGSTKSPNLGSIDDGGAGAGDGAYAFTAVSVDQFGRRSAAATRTFTLDTAPPDAPVVLAPGPMTAVRSVRFAWTPVGDAGAGVTGYQVRIGTTVIATLAPGNCAPGRCETGPVTLPGAGTSYSWTVRATDAVGNVRDSAVQNLVVDTSAVPAPVITQAPAALGSGRTPSFAWQASSADYSQFWWRIVGTSQGASPTTATSATATALADGTYVLGVRQRAAGGSWGEEARASFTVDGTAPAAPALGLTAAEVGDDTTPSFGWAPGEAGSTFRWQVLAGGQAVRSGEVAGTSVEVTPALGAGVYVFSVIQADAAGNVSPPATRGFAISGPAPAPAASSGGAVGGTVTPPATSARTRPAVTGARVTWRRADRRLVLRLTGLAAGARATLAGKRITVRKGVAIVPWSGPGTAVLVVTVPGSASVAPVRYRVVVTRKGAVKVTPLGATSPRSRALP